MVWYVRCSLVRLVVCEVFTCSTCGLVCVRCSLVHLRCSLVRPCGVCEVFTCSLVVWCVSGVHLFGLWCGVCEVYTCSPCVVVCVRCSLVHLVVWCV